MASSTTPVFSVSTESSTASVSAEVRLDCLERYRALVRGDSAVESLASTLREQFCPKQEDDAERRLMEKFADGIAWLRTGAWFVSVIGMVLMFLELI